MLKIRPSFELPDETDPSYHSFIQSIELLLKKILPEDARNDFTKLDKYLPLVVSPSLQQNSQGFSIVTLCPSNYTQGTGRFISDMLSRWLIPGKILDLVGTRTFCFFFEGSSTEYLINERLATAQTPEDLLLIHQNFPDLVREIKLTLQAVYHARHLMSVKKLSPQEKTALIQENISSLIDRSSKEFDLSIFDQMHQFFIKLSAEEKITQIKAHITPLFKLRTKTFDRDIFLEIQHFVLLFREKFMALRDLRYISRLICYQYLFRKSLQIAINHNSTLRHISLKIFHARNPHPVLGILVGVSLLRENELFKKKHFKESILSCISNISEVPDSFVVDWRNDKIPTFYIEIEKPDKKPFSMLEVKKLRQRLAQELRERIENVSHPVFVSRNEEEVLRHIVILSNELKYVSDIPQVVINFHNQTHLNLTFNVILLRLLKPTSPCLKKLLPSHISVEEIKTVGSLKNKYPKQLNTFKVTLAKAPFFRKDYSLDLHKARQAVVTELTQILGEFRDYNGGMIAKQIETLHALRDLLHEAKVQNDFLMENFFYAIEPPTTQSILHPNLLKTAFLLLLEALEHDFKHSPCYFKTVSSALTLVAAIAAPHPTLKNAILTHLAHLNIPSINLAYSSINVHGNSCLILFFHAIDEQKHAEFIEIIENFLTITYFNNQRVASLVALSS
ncbi:MAG: hypothetical protein V4494_03790 [Chlamydiota bacterium]